MSRKVVAIIVASIASLIIGLVMSNTVMGNIYGAAVACYFGILARIYQAQHKENDRQ